MVCIYNNKLNPDSKSLLHQKLLNTFSSQEEADRWFAFTETDWFIENFGDWKADYTREQKILNTEQVNRIGEPELHTNQYGFSFFIMKDGSKHFLDRKVLNLPHQAREALIQSAIYDIFSDNVGTDAEIYDNIDIDAVFNSTEEGSLRDVLRDNPIDLRDLKRLVIARLQTLGLKTTTDKEEEVLDPESDISDDDVLNERLLDLRASYEKNSKDNASANIKFFLSFIPEMINTGDGNIEALIKTTDINGREFPYISFYPFDQIYNKFIESLQNMTSTYNGGEVIPMFRQMIDRMVQDHSNDASVMYAIDVLQGMPEFKKNEFVQAFLLHKVYFDTNLVEKLGTGIKHTTFESDKAVTPAKKKLNEWNANFKKSSLIDNTKTVPQYKTSTVSQLLNRYSKLLNDISKSTKEKEITQDNVDRLLSFLNYTGITISPEGLSAYIYGFTADTPNGQLNLAANKIKFIFTALAKKKQTDIVKQSDVVGIFSNRDISGNVLPLAESESKFNKDMAESTILGAKGKKYWIYSNPSYLSNKVLRLKIDPESEIPNNTGFYQNSILLEKFRDPENNKDFIDNFKILTFGNLREKNNADEGVDNKSITQADQLTDQLNKSLGPKKNEQATFYTPIPADKGRLMEITGVPFYETTMPDTDVLSNEVIDIFGGYLIDELERISEELVLLEDVEGNKDRLYKDYHFILVDGKPVYHDDKGNPVGNAFKSILFRGLSPFNLNDEFKSYFSEGRLTISNDAFLKEKIVRDYIKNNLLFTIERNKQDLINQNLIARTNQGLVFNSLDTEIMSKYLADHSNDRDFAIDSAVSDYTINNMISNIEYSKVFSGDYAYYKNLEDLSKRYPATYTDGIPLNLREGDNADFKVAVLPNIIIDSHSIEQIREFSPQLAKAYKNVNATDAQGWITLDRWKFIMKRSNHWNPKFEEAYNRMVEGTSTIEDYKLAAQPLKGVHFEKTDGVPTYIKYSAAVLIPSAIKGTSLERLNQAMLDQGVSEAVVIDGIKVGAKVPSDVLDENGKLKQDIQFNTINLRNHNYKIQQDLRPKGVKQTLLGSQFKKVILGNLQLDGDYNGILGEDLAQEFNDVISDLSNKELLKLEKEVGISADGNIVNKELLTSKIIESLEERGANQNLINALKKGYDYDYIANYRQKIQNTVMSIINNATIKIKTNGASYIQMSSWGIDEFEAEDIGIKWLGDNNPSNLKAPRVHIDKDGKKKVLPGQVFITSNYIAEFIPNWKSIPAKDLKKIIDKKMLKLIGYRIPNQGMSSNDSLEIVGILPEGMGDTIVPYVDITTKTGSDFDIDKMYVMIPNGEMKNGRLQYIKYDKTKPASSQKKEAVENRLIELAQHVLESPLTYESMMSPLDNPFLKDDIKGLHSKTRTEIDENGKLIKVPIQEDEVSNEFFSPTYQMQKKFDNAGGKAGTGIVANNVTDHTWTQLKTIMYDGDIGFGHTTEDEFTSFAKVKDIREDNKITDVLSWFLSANVDMAKDPFLNKGNYNQYTLNTGMMLTRAGVPIKFINRLVGQEIVMELSKIDSLRKSRVSEPDFRKLEEAAISNLVNKYNINYNIVSGIKIKGVSDIVEDLKIDKLEKIENYENELENSIKSDNKDENWFAKQIEYMNLFLYLRNVGEKLSETVLASKQDVNGGGKDFISAYVDRNRLEKAMDAGFINFESKFQDTFLGTAYNNSTELSISLMEKLFVTSNRSAQVLYDSIYAVVNPNSNGITNSELGFEMEKSYFAHILGQSVFSRTNEELNSMFKGTDTVYDRMLQTRNKIKDNYFLNKLDVHTKKGMKFISMDSTKNSSPEELTEISRSWEELINHEDENIRQLGEDLITYSFYQSGFRSNIGSFFEHIPVDKLKDMVEYSISEAKQTFSGGYIGANNFVDKFFRNNWKNDQIVPYATGRISKGTLTINRMVKGTERNKYLKPYIKVNSYNEFGEIVNTRLWKNMGFNTDERGNITSAVFVPVSKLGMNEEGSTIYEYNNSIPIDGISMIESNNAGVDINQRQANINNILKSIDEGKRLPYSSISSTINKFSAIQDNRRNPNKDLNRGLDNGEVDKQC